MHLLGPGVGRALLTGTVDQCRANSSLLLSHHHSCTIFGKLRVHGGRYWHVLDADIAGLLHGTGGRQVGAQSLTYATYDIGSLFKARR
jgi:hypothetical protein